MVKKKASKTNTFLTSLGRPAFNLIIFTISLIGFILILLEKISQLKNFPLDYFRIKIKKSRLPAFRLHFPQLKLIRQAIPQTYTLNYLRKKTCGLLHWKPVSLPKIKFPKLRYLIFGLSTLSLTTYVYVEIFRSLPDPKILQDFPSKLTTQILDRNGVLLYKIYKDENRTLISLSSLPPHVKNAFLAAEDKDFYNHQGFSLSGLLRALYKNIFDEKMEGGSTITQQLIKNTILTSEKTITRKIKEIILAIETEHLFSKDKIFEMYLNQVGFGGPAYGIQEASRQYFDIDAQDMDLAQAAFLAGLTQAPSKYSPFGDKPELANSRQQWVLNQMYKDQLITEDELKESLNKKLVFQSAKIEIKAPHFVMLVKSILVEQLGENMVTQGGLKVFTTLDASLQDEAQKIVTFEVNSLKKLNVSNGSALVTNPKTGEVLAMVGSKDYFDLNNNGQVNITISTRQPGSSIKPLNYALYFENGHSPATVIDDRPITIHLSGQESWTPKNYDGRFHGTITLRQALGSSYNIPSVLLLAQNGTENFASFAKSLGITTWTDPARYGLSMALGSLEVKMVDLATAYSSFANEGVTTPLRTIIRVEEPTGKQLHIAGCPSNNPNLAEGTSVNAEGNTCSQKRTMSSNTAYLISDILSDNSARTPAFGRNSILNIKSAIVAVKTGTSNDLKDNWTIGYTDNFLVATWVGNNDNSPMSEIASGITGASPIWAKIFNKILETNHEPTQLIAPEDLVKVKICVLTGTLTCSGCPTRTDYFVKGTEPKSACDPEDIQRRLHPTNPKDSPTPQTL